VTKTTTRILLPRPPPDDGFSVLELPTRAVALSLFNDTAIPADGSPKTIAFDECWANGDGVEIVVRRIPGVVCRDCGRSLAGVRKGPLSQGGHFQLYDRDCPQSTSANACRTTL
jgi:hypothetical protein